MCNRVVVVQCPGDCCSQVTEDEYADETFEALDKNADGAPSQPPFKEYPLFSNQHLIPCLLQWWCDGG